MVGGRRWYKYCTSLQYFWFHQIQDSSSDVSHMSFRVLFSQILGGNNTKNWKRKKKPQPLVLLNILFITSSFIISQISEYFPYAFIGLCLSKKKVNLEIVNNTWQKWPSQKWELSLGLRGICTSYFIILKGCCNNINWYFCASFGG